MKLLGRLLCCFHVIMLMCVVTAAAQEIMVKDAWVRGVPHSAKTTAAFMSIQNTGADETVLTSANCEVAEVVQIHTMEQVGEVMKMKQIHELRIPANGQTALAPKGYHIMLMGLIRPINEGETIPLRLNFADGLSVAVDAVVKKWGPMAPMSHD